MELRINSLFGDTNLPYRLLAPYKYAIVRRHANTKPYPEFAPDIPAMQNGRGPYGVPGVNDTGEGLEIPIMANWWKYIKKTNSDKGFAYTQSVGLLWMNDRNWVNAVPGVTTGMAVSHIGGGNFISYDTETATHVHLVAYDYRMNTDTLDPKEDCWKENATMFWKASATNMEEKIINVGNIDVYFPLIKGYADLWMNKKQLELLPVGPDYVFRGCNVYDGKKPLMTVVGRTRTFHTSWKIETMGVIPPP